MEGCGCASTAFPGHLEIDKNAFFLIKMHTEVDVFLERGDKKRRRYLTLQIDIFLVRLRGRFFTLVCIFISITNFSAAKIENDLSIFFCIGAITNTEPLFLENIQVRHNHNPVGSRHMRDTLSTPGTV